MSVLSNKLKINFLRCILFDKYKTIVINQDPFSIHVKIHKLSTCMKKKVLTVPDHFMIYFRSDIAQWLHSVELNPVITSSTWLNSWLNRGVVLKYRTSLCLLRVSYYKELLTADDSRLVRRK